MDQPGPPAWDDPTVAAVPDGDALVQPPPEYVFDQQVATSRRLVAQEKGHALRPL